MDTASPPVKAENAAPPDGAQDSQPALQVAPPVLVDEFKRRGHFDLLRKTLFNEFKQSPQFPAFLQQLDACLDEHLQKDLDRLASRDVRLCHSELMRELDRLPLLENLVKDLSQKREATAEQADAAPLLGSDGAMAKKIEEQVQQLVQLHTTPAQGESSAVESS